MPLPLFIAKKIYNSEGDRQKVSRPAIRIAIIGVALGLAVMLVSVSVVLGFKHTIRDKIVGFGSHVTVADFFTLQSSHPRPIQVNDSVMKSLARFDGVKHVQRYAMTEGVLKTERDFLGVVFKGVAEEFDSTFLSQNLVEGSVPHFSSEKSGNRILVSASIANKLDVHAGSTLYGYFLNDGDVRMRKYTVAGVYQTNLKKFDDTMCFADLYSIVRLNGWESDQVTGAELTLNDFSDKERVYDVIIDSVNKRTDAYGGTYCSATVDEQNPQIFTWLDLLDMNVWIILALMVCVTGFTIISGLLIIILERVQMIGILKALGARNSLVRHTFLWFAVFIVGKGMLWGNVLGIGICLLQKYTGFVSLDPATYYVSEAPVEINVPLFLLVNVAVFVISVMMLVVPSFLVSHVHPARSMRYE